MKKKQSSVILLFRDDGQMALQLRAAHDSKYPNHWDFSAAGGIDPGEDHLTAANRELKEELGVESDLQFVSEELYTDEKEEDRLFVYRARYNGLFTPDPNEVSEARYFPLDSIRKMLASGVKFHPQFPFLWDKGVIAKAAVVDK